MKIKYAEIEDIKNGWDFSYSFLCEIQKEIEKYSEVDGLIYSEADDQTPSIEQIESVLSVLDQHNLLNNNHARISNTEMELEGCSNEDVFFEKLDKIINLLSEINNNSKKYTPTGGAL